MASRYLNIQILSGSSISDPRYYKNALYPEVEASENDTYIITTSDDRLDLLAYDFFGDPKKSYANKSNLSSDVVII
jgi:hypothetical protein